MIGRAAHAIQEYGQAELAYRKALEVAPDSSSAWAGLARLYAATANSTGAVEANEKVVGVVGLQGPRRDILLHACCLAPRDEGVVLDQYQARRL